MRLRGSGRTATARPSSTSTSSPQSAWQKRQNVRCVWLIGPPGPSLSRVDSPPALNLERHPSCSITTGRSSVLVRKLASGKYRLYSRKKNPRTGKRRDLGTFQTREQALRHERAVQFFKRKG